MSEGLQMGSERRDQLSMRVCGVGAGGYVGLVTSVGLAAVGHHVIGVDVNEEAVEKLQRGISPIHEEGLTAVLEESARAGRLRFTTELAEAVPSAEVIFIAVATPSREEDDLRGW